VPVLGLSRVVVSGAVLAGIMSVAGRSGIAPNACKFISVAEVTALLGKAVGGGQMSVVDNPKSLTSTCMYTVAGRPAVIVLVGDYPSAAAAQQELATERENAQDNTVENGIGDGAFSTSVIGLSITAVKGQRVASIAALDGTPALHDRLHALMVTALSR
jgi:hypothetical protein